MKRTLPFLALALAAAAAPACGPSGPEPPSGRPAGIRSYRVGVQAVASRSLDYAIEAVGSVEAYDVVAIPARVSGTLESLSFDEGDPVTPDHVLAVVDGKRYRLQVEQARAVLGRVEASVESALARTRQAGAALREAEAGLARRRGLREKNQGWVTEDEISTLETAAARAQASLEEARAGEKVAAAQVEEARSAVALAQKDLDDARVLSPIAGTIERRHVAVGQYVKEGEKVATLVDGSRLRVRFRVSESESVRIRPGQPVGFRVAAFPGKAFSAEVFHVNATADPVTRMVECLARVKDPEEGLRPGFFASVDAVVSRRSEALVVPSAAVLPTERGFTAFVVEDGKARERLLRLGLHTRDGGVEVVSGLAKGETLVVDGAAALQEGVPVEIAAPAPPPAAPGRAAPSGPGGPGGKE